MSTLPLYEKEEDGGWRYSTIGEGGTLVIRELGVEIPVDEIYRDLPPEEEEAGADGRQPVANRS